MTRILCLLSLLLIFLLGSCGYTLSNLRREDLRKIGVRTVFVKPVENNSYKPGVENLIFNHVVAAIAAQKTLRLVLKESEADAFLKGSVSLANYTAVASTRGNKLFPSESLSEIEGPSDRLVASIYSANLTAAFDLRRTAHSGTASELVWSGSFSRSQIFSGNNQLGIYGTTSALINESEFYRALELAGEAIASDLHESMTSRF